jgi:hypothetical protein
MPIIAKIKRRNLAKIPQEAVFLSMPVIPIVRIAQALRGVGWQPGRRVYMAMPNDSAHASKGAGVKMPARRHGAGYIERR